MTEFTVEQYRTAARNALAAGDTEAAQSLIARGQALEAEAAPFPELSALSQNPQVSNPSSAGGGGGGVANIENRLQPSPSLREQMGLTIPQMAQAGRDNIMGDDDPTTLNRGELIGAALNKAGESLSMGIVGDEAAGKFDELTGRRDDGTGVDFYRQQERVLASDHPGLNLSAEIGGALLGPGKIGASFINAGRGGSRIMRGAAVGAGSGGIYGAAEGEDIQGRVQGGLLSGSIGAVGGGAITAVGQGFNRALQSFSRNPALKDTMPTIEGLREASRSLYKAAEDSGAVLPAQRVRDLAVGVQRRLSTDGYNARLHPRLSVVIDELNDLGQGPQSIQRMEQARRVASNAAQTLQPDEKRLALTVVDQIDDAVDGIGSATEPLRAAREIWGRMRRMEAVETIIENAGNTKNPTTALASGFRSLLKNKKRVRGFSEQERAAMSRIASGRSVSGALQGLGKLMNPASFVGAVTSGGALLNAGPVGAIVPLAGIASKTLGNAGVTRQAEMVRRMSGQNPQTRGLIEFLAAKTNPLSQAPGLLGAIMQTAE